MRKSKKLAISLLFFTLSCVSFAVFNGGLDVAYAKTKELTSAKAMAVMEVESGRLLYAKNESEKLPNYLKISQIYS